MPKISQVRRPVLYSTLDTTFWRQTGHMQAEGDSWNEVVMITVVDVTGVITTEWTKEKTKRYYPLGLIPLYATVTSI